MLAGFGRSVAYDLNGIMMVNMNTKQSMSIEVQLGRKAAAVGVVGRTMYDLFAPRWAQNWD
jgi:hypothetical protein